MKNFSVDYVVPAWIEINVKADTEEEAKEMAKKEIEKIRWKLTRKMSVIDYSLKYSGLRDTDTLNEVNRF